MQIILRWLLNTLALIIVAFLVPGLSIASYYSALIAALFLGIVNAVIRPIIIFLTLPINILTLGLFTLFINGFMFWIVASFVKGFDITNFWSAFFAALVYALITMLTNSVIREPKR